MNTDSNIEIELKELSPLLLELRSNKENHFKVPENYFNNLKSEVFQSVELGFSESIGKQSFKVPENYFDGLSSSIMNAIDESEDVETINPSKGKVIELNSSRKRHRVKPIRIYAMVAAVAMLILFMNVIGDIIVKPFNHQQNDTFSDDAIEYIEENYEEFDSEELFALVELNDEFIELDIVPTLEDEMEEYINEYIDDIDLSYISSEI